MINSAKGKMKKAKSVMSMQHGASIMYHNIASKSAQSNSAYVSALHNLVEHPDGVSKLLNLLFFFLSRAAKSCFRFSASNSTEK